MGYEEVAGREKSRLWRGGRRSRREAGMEVVAGVKRKKKIGGAAVERTKTIEGG